MENLKALSRQVRNNLCHLAIFFLLFSLSPYSSGNRLYSEYELKSAYIFNFLKFIEWPKTELGHTDQLRICAYSSDPILPYLKNLERRQVRGLAINVRVYDSADDVALCHLIYLNVVSPTKRSDILSRVAGQPILTIGNQDAYSDNDEIINFFEENERLRFDIHYGMAQESGLKISSQLLKLARISEQHE